MLYRPNNETIKRQAAAHAKSKAADGHNEEQTAQSACMQRKIHNGWKAERIKPDVCEWRWIKPSSSKNGTSRSRS